MRLKIRGISRPKCLGWASMLAILFGLGLVDRGAYGEQAAVMPTATEILSAKLSALQSLSMSYTQFMPTVNETPRLGMFYLERSGKFRLESDDQTLVISDGESIWEYDALLQQAKVKTFASLLDWSPAKVLLMKHSEIDQRFSVLVSEDAEGQHFSLEPKDPEALIRTLTLSFKANKPSGLRVAPRSGNEVVFALKTEAVNSVLDTDLFEFNPPAQTDVIDFRP